MFYRLKVSPENIIGKINSKCFIFSDVLSIGIKKNVKKNIIEKILVIKNFVRTVLKVSGHFDIKIQPIELHEF